ncbi:MAG TPA: hypothetical protein VFX16_29175 [Pseudonocardiaceae bacterium]|nr:hypothetical protein [Pseudonocardiaceae bacterium]
MAALVGQANEKSKPHYIEVSEGWLRYLGRRQPVVVDVGTARWTYGNLEVRLTPHLALQEPDGTTSAVFLHFKQAPLSRDAADMVLWLMEETMNQLRPRAQAVAVDVRRSKQFMLKNRNRQKIGAWVRSEALAFLSLWDAAA